MKLLKAKRLVAAASVVAAAGIVPVITATPASADQVDCVTFLKNRNYIIGAKVRAACNIKHLPVGANPVCLADLVVIGVTADHANRACRLA
ncbi:hypothetical protein [Streptomyces canus]|uniref:hypothetical protein n=1 Tax=Streptomyces canus TaxID=58343 RepID=UPI0022514F45|nr:hypothetical protein [Streptomyces canus]